tara:strand:- start:401 stop:799 length:399 start_codon:yes stop_codon:yes gene_type:complete
MNKETIYVLRVTTEDENGEKDTTKLFFRPEELEENKIVTCLSMLAGCFHNIVGMSQGVYLPGDDITGSRPLDVNDLRTLYLRMNEQAEIIQEALERDSQNDRTEKHQHNGDDSPVESQEDGEVSGGASTPTE